MQGYTQIESDQTKPERNRIALPLFCRQSNVQPALRQAEKILLNQQKAAAVTFLEEEPNSNSSKTKDSKMNDYIKPQKCRTP